MNKILKWLNLNDREGNLSLTNISLIVVLVKIAISPFDFTGAALLLPVIASYMQKRYESNKVEKEVREKEVMQDLTPLLQEIELLKANQVEMNKVALDTQKIVSQANLAAAFSPRK